MTKISWCQERNQPIWNGREIFFSESRQCLNGIVVMQVMAGWSDEFRENGPNLSRFGNFRDFRRSPKHFWQQKGETRGRLGGTRYEG
jgi:hypothetical protein